MSNNTEEKRQRRNPFLEPYGTPHDTVPFGDIHMEDFEEAFMEGIRRDNELIDKTVNNTEKPTFDNTIINTEEDKEGYYDLLSRVSTVFFNLLSAETNDEMDALAQKIQPILTQHANDVRLNKRLFERVKAVHRHHRRLTPEEKRLLDDSYDGFVRSGALLDEEGKARLRSLTEEASMLSLQFSQNLLKENKAYSLHITDEKQLEGLPDTAREAAALAAKEQGKEGWIFTLDYPSFSPFMTYSTQRDLRKEMYMARNTECTHDNTENNIEICRRIVNLRREIAQLLGYRTYAEYVLKNRMAGNARNVYRLLDDLITAYKPTALKEVAEIEKTARKAEGKDFEMQPWDFGYYSHKLQLKKFNLDAEMLRPYFELSRVIGGVFGLANRLYGITFKENKDIQVYHKDVKAYEVFDADGSFLAVFYAVFHPRTRKRIQDFGLAPLLAGLRICEPLGYLETMSLTCASRFIISDSGGLQKEAYYAGKRCVVMMPDTGWRELTDCGWNVLCAPQRESILAAADRVMAAMPCPQAVYGDGAAAKKIIDSVLGALHSTPETPAP